MDLARNTMHEVVTCWT